MLLERFHLQFGRAEGCGVMVLKRLSDALRDRDNIWALIRGSAVAQEGLSRSLGTPTEHCEALSMKLAMKDANVSPEQVSFVETHGTGTAVGDPLEVAAIARAYHTPLRKTPLVIGSVKTNVGHTESCSGITGIMKTVLAMQHQRIPKHRNLVTLNPEICLDSIPAIIPMEQVAWPKVKGQPRIAGVSSFGITGTDGHVILQEAPDYKLAKFSLQLERPTHVLKISGKTSEALDELLKRYENEFSLRAEGYDPTKDDAFGDAAFTANVGRANFNHRVFIIAQDYQEAAKALADKHYIQGEIKDNESRQLCFLFPGQGSQYQGMAKTLYETSPVFRIHFDECDRVLRTEHNLTIRNVLWKSGCSSKGMSRTIYSQTAIFSVEYCLLKLWQSWGIQPDYVLGHSLGEFAAVVAAGFLDFPDAITLVAERCRLIDNLPQGSMLVIKAGKPEVDRLLANAKIDLDFAAVNNPEQTVLAGDTDQIQSFLEYVKGKGLKGIILEATHAFHSRHMDTILNEYREIAQRIKYKPGSGKVRYVSGVLGKVICGAEMDADYWVRHTREKVSFIDACMALRETGCQDFVEVGPQPVLSSFVMLNIEDKLVNCFPSLRRGTEEWQTILTTLGKLYLLGYNVDWKGFDEPYNRAKVSLPFHPFNRKSFWVESTDGTASIIHPLLGYPINNATSMNIFQNALSLKSVPYLKDHCVGSRILFPGAGYMEMCLTAACYVANGCTEKLESPKRPMTLENLRIDAPLELKENKSCRLQVVVDVPTAATQQEQVGGFRVKVFHQNTWFEESDKWILHASSTFIPAALTKDKMKLWNPERISEIRSKGEENDSELFYKRIDQVGLKYGPAFRPITRYWRLKQENTKHDLDDIVTELTIPLDYSKYILHPVILDAVFQSGILTRAAYDDSKLKVPVRVEQLTLFSGIPVHEIGVNDNDPSLSLFVHAWIDHAKLHMFLCTRNANYTPIALVEDLELIDTNVRTIESVLEQQSSSVPDAWEEIWKVIPSPFTSFVSYLDPISVVDDASVTAKCCKLRDTAPKDKDLWTRTNRLVYLYILNALMELGWQPLTGDIVDVNTFCTQLGIGSEFKQLVRFYFTAMWTEAEIMSKDPTSDYWAVTAVPPTYEEVKKEKHALCHYLKTTKVSTVIGVYENIARSLAKVLKGEESALAILFPTDEDKQHLSAECYYQNHPCRGNLSDTILTVCQPLFEKQHSLPSNGNGKVCRILEVGSGTGSMSAVFIHKLKGLWGDHFEFYYTDISQSFFVKAEKRFEEYKSNVKYAVFNIEQSPLSQGIPIHYFDFVIATDVLHATRDLKESLVHIRQTLRPGGVFCFTETLSQAVDITFVFGLLNGYWRFEDYECRPYHACASEQVWTKLLLETGFDSVRCFKVYNDQFGCVLAVASEDDRVDRLTGNVQRIETKLEWVIFSDASNIQLTSALANMLDASGFHVTIVHKLDNGQRNEKERALLKTSIHTRAIEADSQNIAEMESVLLGSSESGDNGRLHGVIYSWGLDENEIDQKRVALPFLHIAKIFVGLRKPPQLYLLSEGIHLLSEDVFPCNPTVATLLGMAKSLKNESVDIFIRCVDLERGCSPSQMVDQVLYEIAMHKGFKEQHRFQVVYRNGIRYEPRIVKATFQSDLKLPPFTDRYHLILPKTRMIKDLEFDAMDMEEVEEKEIEIKIKAFALNFRDIITILKPTAEFENFNTVGLDFSGVVTKAGALSKVKVGDRVFGANFKEAQLPSHLILDSSSVLQIPERMTFWEAATLPAVFSTAYHCLITIAGMKTGDTVLIHTGSGGVGLAAIQLAKRVGANIITTAGTRRKRTYLRSLGVEHVFHSRNTSYEKNIMQVTSGTGVDIVLNSITGPGFKEATLASCAKNARFVEMSKLSVWTRKQVETMRADVAYSIVDLTTLERDTWTNLLAKLRTYLAEGHFKAIPYVKFDALNIRQAFEYFQKARHIGKVVCVMPEVTSVDGQFTVTVPLFNSDSSYLITGGLGGIGFEVCKWMLGRGATDIVLTGRSPLTSHLAAQIQQLNNSGFKVMVKLGDVGNFEQCKRIIDEIKREEKPLRGLMHCAGVLHNNLFANQTWDGFQATFTPKVNGTWNLHNLTKTHPMEHFIMFSSVTAQIGTPGQPNHAAANSFEDAFINYRHSLGLPGATINWGQWSQVGCAKELLLSGILPVSVTRMLNGLEVAMRVQKRQICFSEFDSFLNLSMLAPLLTTILDERLWATSTDTNTLQNHNKAFKSEDFWKELDVSETKEEKMQVLSGYLKDILRSALRLDADETISDDANLQELGADSLMMIELKNSIQTLVGNRMIVAASLLKNCTTIRDIAKAVINKMVDDLSGEEVCLDPKSKENVQVVTTRRETNSQEM